MKKQKKRFQKNLAFADTDFLVALIKDSDWLKSRAETVLKTHKGRLNTSISVMIEIALLCRRWGLRSDDTFAAIFELVKMKKAHYDICLKASVYIEEYSLNVFDAFHAASCGKETIISSDSAYDKIGMKRIALEAEKLL